MVTTDQTVAAIGAYAAAFGEGAAEEIIALNYLANPAFTRALQEAVAANIPLTKQRAAELFGPPFQEFVS